MGSCGSRPASRRASDSTRRTVDKSGSDSIGISEGSKTNAKQNTTADKTPVISTSKFLPPAAAVVVGDQSPVADAAAAADADIHHNQREGVSSQRPDGGVEGALALLPIELLRSTVLSFLGASCLARAGGASTVWRKAATDEHLWKRLCLRHWVGKHVALLEGMVVPPSDKKEQHNDAATVGDGPVVWSAADSSSSADDGYDNEEEEEEGGGGFRKRRRRRDLSGTSAECLRGGLEELVAAMPIKDMRRRLEEVGANPRRLGTCLEKAECVSVVMASMLLSREGLLREAGQLPPWVSALRGWRWSYYYAKADARRCWMTMDDLVRSPWIMSFPAEMPSPASPLLLPSVSCEFHCDFSYTDEGFHQDGLGWHFEDSHRCVKVSNYPALEAERIDCWGWRLVNAHVIFKQQRAPPPSSY